MASPGDLRRGCHAAITPPDYECEVQRIALLRRTSWPPSIAPGRPSCTFSVTVRDTLAPTLTCPADVQKGDAPPQGTAVDYPPATASDAVDAPVLSYSQASGTLFPVGTTPVTVTATDASGNSSTCTFQVRVDPRIQEPPEPPEPPPSEGCGCGAGSSTPAGLSWGVLMLLTWGVARRRCT